LRYLILGAGALGGFFGGKLLKSGADVTFLVRPRRAEQLQRDGLINRMQDGEIRTPVRTVLEGQIDAPYDLIVLPCKAYDLDDAISAIAPGVGEHSAILPLLNGIAHIDVLKERFGADRVLGGLTIINAVLLPDGVIQQGELRINTTTFGELTGKLSSRCCEIQKAFKAANLHVDLTSTIVADMWDKFFTFACIAVITSMTRSRAGVIAGTGSAAEFVSAVVEECARVVAAEGFPPAPGSGDVIRSIFSQPDSSYGPSLLVDMEQGRRTEGQHTIGDLVGRANKQGVSAPLLTAALCNIQAYEFGRIRPAE